jgi:hypothetical protein
MYTAVPRPAVAPSVMVPGWQRPTQPLPTLAPLAKNDPLMHTLEEIRVLLEAQREEGKKSLTQDREGIDTQKKGIDSSRVLASSFARAASALPGGRFVGHALNIAQAATGSEAKGIAQAAAGLGMLAGPMGAIVAAAPAAAGALTDLKQSIIHFGGIASPGELIRWQLATEKIQAAIGRSLIPVFELMTHGANLLADGLHSVLPSMGEVREALAPVREALDELRPEFAKLVPAFKELAKVGLAVIAFQITNIARAFKLLVEYGHWISPAFALIKALAPEGKPSDLKAAPPAPRPAQFSGVEEYLFKSYQSALTQAMGIGGTDPLQQVAGNTGHIKNAVDDIYRHLTGQKSATWAGRAQQAAMAANNPISGVFGWAATFGWEGRQLENERIRQRELDEQIAEARRRAIDGHGG